MRGTLAFIFEFGIPHYRFFLINFFKRSFENTICYHAGDKFSGVPRSESIECCCFGKGENRLCMFNFFALLPAAVVITTMNLRRPHTWLPMLLFPWKKWVVLGGGVGRNNSFFARALRKILLGISDGFVVYTEGGKRELIGVGYPPHKISVAYNTLKVDNSCLTKGGSYFLYVGRVQKRKQLDLCFSALKVVNKKLLIVGDDYEGEISRLKSAAADQQCEHLVEFMSGVYCDSELKNIFEGAIAYVSPGHVGLGVAHAFSYGVPVLTLACKDHAPEFEYCSGDNSYLIYGDGIVDAFLDCVGNLRSHSEKRKAAYAFYREKLSCNNVYDAYFYHFKRLGVLKKMNDDKGFL